MLSHSLFHSRIGRRILGLFVLCALVPTSLLGWLSYRQVTQELIVQSAARLKQESKSQGMVLYNHLLTLTADLSRISGAAARRHGDRRSCDHHISQGTGSSLS